MLKAVGFPSNLVPAQCKEKFFVTSQEKFNELLVVMANSEDLLEMSGCRIECRIRGGAHTFAGQLLCVGSFLTALLPNLKCKLLPIPAILTQKALSDATEAGLFRLDGRALEDPASSWKTLAYARVLHCIGIDQRNDSECCQEPGKNQQPANRLGSGGSCTRTS